MESRLVMSNAPEKLWYKTAIFYEVSVKSFMDTSGNGIGDIKGITAKLDYLRDLGVTCLWLLPFYPSPWKDDGYDVADYYNIADMLGTMEDFNELLIEAQKRDIRIIIDFVSNHTSDQHPWFKEARKSTDNPYRDYYVWSKTDAKYRDVRVIFNDFEDSNWEYDDTTGEYYWHRFFYHQPDLNYDNPKVHEEIFKAMEFWLDKGIAGFRVDAIPYLYEREGTSCENLEETHQFLKKMRKHIDGRYGPNEKILLCESNMWQEELIPYFGNEGDEFQMGFDFPVMPRIYEALARQRVDPLLPILSQYHELGGICQWATFLRNHDELTLEKVTEPVREFMWNHFTASDPRAKINLGIRRRLAPLLENDRQKIELLNAFLFALPGSPIIYYGDEIGMGDNLDLEDRNGVRTPMQWDNSQNAGFSTASTEDLVFPINDDPIYGYQKINVASQLNDPNSLLNWMRSLIRYRKSREFMGYGNFAIMENNERRGIVFRHRYNKKELFAAFNFSGDTIRLKINDDKNSHYFAVFADEEIDLTNNYLELQPYGYEWLDRI